ncbi:MAG: hypothetical protein Q4B96_07160 [Bacillota bacterium]|nr:hypothetical protein [Bacillota bacterium]
MFIKYSIRLCLRVVIFLSVFYVYLFYRPLAESFIDFKLFGPLTPLHLLWAVLMGGMLLHLLPKTRITMSGRKRLASTYQAPEQPYDRLELLEYVQSMNMRAWRVMLCWLLLNSVVAALYLLNVIGVAEIFLLTIFYFASDLVCMLIFCPFQTLIMKNRCCVNCRVFDWGHFMMYTPMLLIKSFFSWSLFFTACILLIRWEFIYARHPERFWRGSNATIRCENCQDKICQIKKPLRAVFTDKEADN